jgi:hypothetical protein
MRRLLWIAAALALVAPISLSAAAAPAAQPPAASAEQSAAAIDLFAGTYTQTRSSGPNVQTFTLVLRPNETCTLNTTSLDRTARPVVEQGTWRSDGRSLTILLTEANRQPEKNEITFEPRGDRLVAVRFDRDRYGSEGLALDRKRAARPAPPKVPVEGTYTENRAGGDAPQKLTLVLNANRSCSLTTEFPGSSTRPVVETGSWRYRGGWVTLILDKVNRRRQDNVIKFRQREGELIAVDYDRQRYGSLGLTLKKQ